MKYLIAVCLYRSHCVTWIHCHFLQLPVADDEIKRQPSSGVQLNLPPEVVVQKGCVFFGVPKCLIFGIPKSSKVRYVGWQFGQSTGEQTGALEAFLTTFSVSAWQKATVFRSEFTKCCLVYLTVVFLCFIASLLVPLMIFGFFLLGGKLQQATKLHKGITKLQNPCYVHRRWMGTLRIRLYIWLHQLKPTRAENLQHFLWLRSR